MRAVSNRFLPKIQKRTHFRHQRHETKGISTRKTNPNGKNEPNLAVVDDPYRHGIRAKPALRVSSSDKRNL
jgi:hypothetical protein